MKVNFFIAGAAKCWSSSLYDTIIQHPDVFMCPIKEVNHFNTDFHLTLSMGDSKFERLLRWSTQKYFEGNTDTIMAWLVKDPIEYKKLYNKGKNSLIRWEASIWYMHSKDAFKNIYNYNKDAKILFILRDPVKRFISHYWMLQRMWFTDKSLLEIIDYHKKWLDLTYHESILFEWSKYCKHISKYENTFWSKQVLIINSLKLKDDFQNTMNKVTFFLDIDTYEFNTIVTNVWLYWNKYLFMLRRGILYIKNCLPSKIVAILNRFVKPSFDKLFWLLVSKKVPLTWNEILSYLYDFYNEDIVYLEEKWK